jgi:hypothetical protein
LEIQRKNIQEETNDLCRNWTGNPPNIIQIDIFSRIMEYRCRPPPWVFLPSVCVWISQAKLLVMQPKKIKEEMNDPCLSWTDDLLQYMHTTN